MDNSNIDKLSNEDLVKIIKQNFELDEYSITIFNNYH